MTDIKSMNKEELKDLMVQVGEKPFRAKQIYSWLHEHLVTSYEEMGNIPGKLKEKLKKRIKQTYHDEQETTVTLSLFFLH